MRNGAISNRRPMNAADLAPGSASLLVNRESGRGVSSSTFDSREAIDHNREHAKELRNTRTRYRPALIC